MVSGLHAVWINDKFNIYTIFRPDYPKMLPLDLLLIIPI